MVIYVFRLQGFPLFSFTSIFIFNLNFIFLSLVVLPDKKWSEYLCTVAPLKGFLLGPFACVDLRILALCNTTHCGRLLGLSYLPLLLTFLHPPPQCPGSSLKVCSLAVGLPLPLTPPWTADHKTMAKCICFRIEGDASGAPDQLRSIVLYLDDQG